MQKNLTFQNLISGTISIVNPKLLHIVYIIQNKINQ